MSDQSAIHWTDATWNFLRGCSLVSPGCTNCYAMTQAGGPRLGRPAGPYEGLTRTVNGHSVWTGEVRVIEHLIEQPLRWQRPRMIFVASMSDPFHESVPDEVIDRAFDVMEDAHWHVYQLLTKRPERMRDYVRLRAAHQERLLPEHIWLGTSVEDQRRADERTPLLLETPIPVRFLSCEPLLDEIDLSRYLWRWPADGPNGLTQASGLLHWVITGGESGPRPRRFDPEWARYIRDQCSDAGVAFFHKQGGGSRSGQNRELDGRLWEQFPDIDHPALRNHTTQKE